MNEKELIEVAEQLANPSGAGGEIIAKEMNKTNVFITERSIERLSPEVGECIVEVGPGNGKLSVPLVEALGYSGHYIGLEQSEYMAQEAMGKLVKLGLADIDMYSGDCIAAPVRENSVDGLIAVNVLYFIDDLQRFFRKVSNWLRPGGRVVFGIRSEQSLKAIPYTRYGFHIRPLEEITNKLKNCGFININTCYFDEGIGLLGELEIAIDSLIIHGTIRGHSQLDM